MSSNLTAATMSSLTGTCKLRNDTRNEIYQNETKRNSPKRDEIHRNETKFTETKRNRYETKLTETE